METTIKSSQNRYVGISILRIIAMLGVFFTHFGQRMGLTGTIREITDFGKYGVELFFVISGFLMVKSLDNCHSTKDILKFYLKRAIRLLVLYYLVVLWYFISETFIFKSIVPDKMGLGWLRYIFLLNGLLPSETYLWSSVGFTWSIPVFFIAYLLTPLLYKTFKLNNTLKLGISFIVLYAISVICSIYFNGWLFFVNYYYIFIGGMFVNKAIEENRMKSATVFLLVITLGMIAVGQALSLLTISTLFMLLLIPMSFFSLTNTKLLKVINVLCEHSYTLYLGHGIIFCSILDKFTLGLAPKLLIAILGTIIITVLLYNCYEKPLTRLLNKKLLKK